MTALEQQLTKALRALSAQYGWAHVMRTGEAKYLGFPLSVGILSNEDG